MERVIRDIIEQQIRKSIVTISVIHMHCITVLQYNTTSRSTRVVMSGRVHITHQCLRIRSKHCVAVKIICGIIQINLSVNSRINIALYWQLVRITVRSQFNDAGIQLMLASITEFPR